MMWEDLLRKFFILQWKNYLLKRRHWVFTLFEIIIPTLLFVSIVAIRNTGGEDVRNIVVAHNILLLTRKGFFPEFFLKKQAGFAPINRYIEVV